MRPASTHHQPMGHNPQVARTPPPWRTRRIRPTQTRWGRRRHGAQLKPARSQRPSKHHPTRPSARPTGKSRPANTTATKTLLDAFMESCMSDSHAVPTPAVPRVCPGPRHDYAEGTTLTMSRQAHPQRNYTALGHIEHATATDDGPATASGAADQAPDERGAPGSGTCVEAGTKTAS